MRAHSLVFFAALTTIACGGAPATGGSTPSGELTMNIPESDWQRFAVPEGSFSLEVPGEPVRRVATRDDGQTFEYVVAREPIAVIVAVENLGAIVVGEAESAGLDAVANLYSQRSAEAGRGCTPGPIETVTHAGHEGRFVVATGCRDLSGGALASVAFIHGSVLIGLVVVGDGVNESTIRALLTRTIQGLELGEPPSWFQPVDTDVAIANVPGLGVRMPRGVASEVVEQEGIVTARYTSEPIRGMAAIVSVTTPARLTAAQYCSAVSGGGALDLTEERNHLGEPNGYCEVRGRVVQHPELFQIHDVMVMDTAVVELMWVGPFRPEFVGGGDAQMAQMRASIHR